MFTYLMQSPFVHALIVCLGWITLVLLSAIAVLMAAVGVLMAVLSILRRFWGVILAVNLLLAAGFALYFCF